MSVAASVVIVIPPAAAKVKVSLLLSATTVDCPLTAMFLNILCEEPLSEFVRAILPEVVTVPLPDIPLDPDTVTEVTVPRFDVLLLNVFQFVEVR